MADVKLQIEEYWHDRSATYDSFPASRKEEEEIKAYETVLDRYISSGQARILDVGAGTGFLSLLLAEKGHWLTALDLSRGMLDKARGKADRLNLAIDFLIGDAESLPFEDNSFDFVVSRWLLWTLPHPEKAVSEWKRVLKPGGSILCIDGLWNSRSLKGCLKTFCRKAGLIFHSRTRPSNLGYNKEIDNQLPFNRGVDPLKALDLFRGCGLVDATREPLHEIRRIRARNMPLLYRLSLAPATELIKGEKK